MSWCEKIEENELKNKRSRKYLPELINQVVPENNHIAIEDASYTKNTVGNTEGKMGNQEHKILGIKWNRKDDSLIFNFESVIEAANTQPPTKRIVILVANLRPPVNFITCHHTTEDAFPRNMQTPCRLECTTWSRITRKMAQTREWNEEA